MGKYLLIVLAATFMIDCAGARSRFEEARKTDTEAGYEEFLEKYPNSPFFVEAQKRLVELSYQEAKKLDYMAAYEAFLRKYPDSPFTARGGEEDYGTRL